MTMKLSDIRGKRVLYIATKNADYLRIVQEIRILKEQGNTVTEIVSAEKSYPKRLREVWGRLRRVNMDDHDLSFIGFAPQLILPLFGRKLGKKPVVTDFFISVYDTICFDRKKLRPQLPLGQLCKQIDKLTLRRSDHCICDTRAHGAYFCEEFGYPAAEMETLYLEADTSIYYPREMPAHKDFTVLYFGSILPLQGVPVILDAIGLLRQEPGLHFVVIGPLGNAPRQGENITEYIDWLPQEQLAERIAGADLCLAGHFDAAIGKARRTIPGKAYIYHAMGKPMILGDNPATHELYHEGDPGITFCKMGDARALADCILSLKKEACGEEDN